MPPPPECESAVDGQTPPPVVCSTLSDGSPLWVVEGNCTLVDTTDVRGQLLVVGSVLLANGTVLRVHSGAVLNITGSLVVVLADGTGGYTPASSSSTAHASVVLVIGNGVQLSNGSDVAVLTVGGEIDSSLLDAQVQSGTGADRCENISAEPRVEAGGVHAVLLVQQVAGCGNDRRDNRLGVILGGSLSALLVVCCCCCVLVVLVAAVALRRSDGGWRWQAAGAAPRSRLHAAPGDYQEFDDTGSDDFGDLSIRGGSARGGASRSNRGGGGGGASGISFFSGLFSSFRADDAVDPDAVPLRELSVSERGSVGSAADSGAGYEPPVFMSVPAAAASPDDRETVIQTLHSPLGFDVQVRVDKRTGKIVRDQ